MKKLLVALVVLTTIVNANNIHSQTNKITCIQQSEHSDKTLDQQKKVIIEQAKQEALEELYGTLIFSSTDITDGKLTSDQIKSRAVGSVRVKGNPKFYNGSNLGEICGDVNVYITKKDLEKYSPKKVKLDRYCFNDTNVAMGDIQNKAREAAYKEMLVRYKPSLKSLSFKQAEALIHGFKESNANFDFGTKSYCFDAAGTILPYELEMGANIKISDKTNNEIVMVQKNVAYKYTKKNITYQNYLINYSNIRSKNKLYNGFKEYLKEPGIKAFAVSIRDNGYNWSYGYSTDKKNIADAVSGALDDCKHDSCQVIIINNDFIEEEKPIEEIKNKLSDFNVKEMDKIYKGIQEYLYISESEKAFALSFDIKKNTWSYSYRSDKKTINKARKNAINACRKNKAQACMVIFNNNKLTNDFYDEMFINQ